MLYVDAMWQFIAVANNFINKTMQDKNFTNLRYEDLSTSIDFLLTNGYSSLMQATWDSEDDYVDHFNNGQLTDYRKALIVILALGLVSNVIFFVIISRMAIRIERINNRVISLFVYISERDIFEIRGKCTQYLTEYLPDIYDNMKGTHIESEGRSLDRR